MMCLNGETKLSSTMSFTDDNFEFDDVHAPWILRDILDSKGLADLLCDTI
jgi:hypothetical protein